MADTDTKVMSWPMIIGIVAVTCLVLVVVARLVTSMLGMSSGAVAAAGACGGAGVVGGILISRRQAALGGKPQA